MAIIATRQPGHITIGDEAVDSVLCIEAGSAVWALNHRRVCGISRWQGSTLDADSWSRTVK